MREWLIKILGGYTLREFELLQRETNSFIEAKESQVVFLQSALSWKETEIKRLTDLMLIRSGFIVPEVGVTKAHAPIIQRESWREKQQRLEREDHEKYLDQVEARWRDRQVQEGNELDSNGASNSHSDGGSGLAD